MFWNILPCVYWVLCSFELSYSVIRTFISLTSWETLTKALEPKCWAVNEGTDLSTEQCSKTARQKRASVNTKHHKNALSYHHETFPLEIALNSYRSYLSFKDYCPQSRVVCLDLVHWKSNDFWKTLTIQLPALAQEKAVGTLLQYKISHKMSHKIALIFSLVFFMG